MPHQIHERKFGRPTHQRRSMLRNLTLSILRYERVKTTEAKAKEIRRFVDRMINLGKDGSLGARREAIAWLPEPVIVDKLFTDLAKRYPDRTSGYMRTTRLARRVGDSASLMLVELMPGAEETAKTEKAAAKAEEKPRRRRLGLPRRGAAEEKDEEAKPAKSTAKKTTPKKKATTKA